MFRIFELAPRFDFELGPFGGFREGFFEDCLIPDRGFEECEWKPAADISETDTVYFVSLELPGIDMKMLDITYSEGVLSVKGEKERDTLIGETCNCSERYVGEFNRKFKIGGPVVTEKIDATYKDGILRVSLPKSEAGAVKKIEIH